MLPEPTLSFTLPSLHDGLPLDCHVYHPRSLIPVAPAPPWRRHAAVVAHPYAPLGGCYDDPNVEGVAEVLLRTGLLVATFNFRGAGSSLGRTSWTARPERSDYMSVVGFIYYYTHFLDPYGHHPPPVEPPRGDTAAMPESPVGRGRKASADDPVLLMAGYSYGSIITMQLPPLADILALFAAPETESSAGEIRQRALHLAEQQNIMLARLMAASLAQQQQQHGAGEHSPRRHLAMRVGEAGDHHRKSHEGHPRRSLSLEEAEEKLRRGVHDLLAKAKHGKAHDGPAAGAAPPQPPPPAVTAATIGAASDDIPHLEAVPGLAPRRAAYLLISPLQGPASHLAAMSFKTSSITSWFARKTKGTDAAAPSPAAPPAAERSSSSSTTVTTATVDGGQADVMEAVDKAAAERKLVENPTLAVFGDQDVFVAVRRLREWTARLQRVEGHRFVGSEIPTAGHFWAEEGVADDMHRRVAAFASGLLGGGP